GGQKPLFKFTPEQLQEATQRPVKTEDLLKPPPAPGEPLVVGPDEPEDDEKGKGKKKPGPGHVPGRDNRQQQRNQRAKARKERAGTEVKVVAGQALVIETDERRRRGPRSKIKPRRPGTVPPKGKAVIDSPITVRALSEAIGVKSGELLFKL